MCVLTIKQGVRLSAIIDKLGLQITDPDADQKAVGADLVMQIVRKAHLAEAELYAFVAEVKQISVDQAASVDIVAFVREFLGPDVISFFASALKSQPPA